MADLRAAERGGDDGLGPIGQATASREFDSIALLHDFETDIVAAYVEWLRPSTSAPIREFPCPLDRPTDYAGIYRAAVGVLEGLEAESHGPTSWVFHLSPGTPAMAAIWLLLGKTRFPAEFLQSSREDGVVTADVPFDLAVDVLPDLLEGPDQRLLELSQGLPPDAPEFADIVHRSTAMRRVIAMARKVAPRSVPVLIQGESGTGKELFARAIHRASPRREGPFVPVNCGAISPELVESELFGHEKGAFTGAARERVGYFEAASRGTLFLDEIGDLPGAAQVKLLRVLQEKEVTRVGATSPIPVDVRIVAATHRVLTSEIAGGRFREDLFYRLAVAVLTLPPLRERRGDVGLLIDALLSRINMESADEPGFVQKKVSASARNLLLRHPWPGNVRELHNTLQRAAIWSAKDTIGAGDIRDALIVAAAPTGGVLDRPLGEDLSLPDLMATVAQHYLTRALEEARGNKTRAAKLVGLPSYQTLSNWIKRYEVTT